MDDVRRPPKWYPEYRPEPQQLEELSRRGAEFLLLGGYDPPLPKIPNLFQRLFLHGWTPPEPTAEEWPMRTKESSIAAGASVLSAGSTQ